jgi:hypothetical protein
MAHSTFSIINDDILIDTIRGARHRIVYVAPEVSKDVATALGARFHELGTLHVTLVLDVDAEVCRLGYGDIEGLELVKSLADDKLLEVRHQPGLRIGLLLADESTIIFAPTPQLIEAGSAEPDKPNAIVLNDFRIAAVERACAVDDTTLPMDAEIGRNVVKEAVLAAVKDDLRENPPKEFDVARAERVFNSRIQYVELSLENYKLSRKIAPIPSELLGLAKDKAEQKRWRNCFLPFEGREPLTVEFQDFDEDFEPLEAEDNKPKLMQYSEQLLEEEKKAIYEDFLYVIPNYGTVVMRTKLPKLTKRFEWWKKRIQTYEEKVKEVLQERLEQSINRLIEAVLPNVKRNPPPRYLKAAIGYELTDDDYRGLLREDFESSFGAIADVFSPKAKFIIKEVSCPSIGLPPFSRTLP